MSIDQLLRYSEAFLIDGLSNGYTLITIHKLKPWVFFAFNIPTITVSHGTQGLSEEPCHESKRHECVDIGR